MSASPAPWRLDEDGDLIAANQVLVAIVPSKEDRALMVAAPDMLEALKAVKAAIELHCQHTGDVIWINSPYQAAAVHESVCERLDAAIAKSQVTA